MNRNEKGTQMNRAERPTMRSSSTALGMRFACACIGALVMVCLLAPGASATFYAHPFISQFGPDGTENTKFNEHASIAVDQISHDVYVVDSTPKRVYRFTGDGIPDNFSEGAGAGTNKLPVPFPAGYQGLITGIAISPAGAAGGTAGDLYVAWIAENSNSLIGRVEVYSPNGVHLGTLDGSGNPHHPPTGSNGSVAPKGVAVDAAGSVYVGYNIHVGSIGETTHVDKYVPTANPVTEANFDSEIFNAGGPLLATASGLYVAGSAFTHYAYSLFPGGGGSVDATGQGTALSLPSGVGALGPGGDRGVGTVDPASGDLYLRYEKSVGFGSQSGVYQLDEEGNPLSFIPTPNIANGVGVDAGTGRVYISNFQSGLNPANKVRIYDKAEPISLPSATIDMPSSVTYKSAHLTGTVNPGGSGEGYETTYRFQCTPSCPGLFHESALPPFDFNRQLPGDGADHEVSDDAAGLSPETKYEVSLIAANANGDQVVEDTTSFETPAEPSLTAPAVTIDTVTSHTAESAHLSGTVDPMGSGPGQETIYRFEYSSDGVKWIALNDQGPIEGAGPQPVSAELEGLQPNTSYSVRLHAKNDGGEATSEVPNPSFTTDVATPEVQVTEATHVLQGSAQLNGKVDPKNSQTTYYFQWGSADCASNPCASVPASKDADAGAGFGFVYEKAPISGLSPSSTYHYRILAESPAGKAVSPDATFTTLAVPTACQNQRVGASASLPECRAYEMVSPVEKNGGDVASLTFRTRAAVAGDAVSFVSYASFAGNEGFPTTGAEYLSSRGADGWSTHSITPLRKSPPGNGAYATSAYVGESSPDLDTGVYRSLAPTPGVAPNVAGATNLLLATGMRGATPSFQLLSDSVTPLGDQPFENTPHVVLVDTSADFSHVLFEDPDNLTEDASGTAWKLYEWENGTLRIAGILPDSACGTPPCIASEAVGGAGAHKTADGPGGTATPQAHAVSDDGSRAFFTAVSSGGLKKTPDGGFEGSLYVRIDGTATVQIDASERSTPDPAGSGRSEFQWASPSGDEVLFLSREQLLDADRDGTKISLYRYEANAPTGQHLSLIPTAGFEPQHVVKVSDDGSFVYAVSTEGSTEALYVLHGGEVRTVAKLGDAGPGVGEQGLSLLLEQARMPLGGRQILFASREKLTDYDPTTAPGNCYSLSCSEIYLYSYDDDELVCVSCDPSGNPSHGDSQFNGLFADAGVTGEVDTYVNTPITADGRHVFFSSADPLVPQDSNGRYDAYVYDVAKKEVRLLSSGQCNCNSLFMTASPSGHDAFFTTRQQLVRIDQDNLSDLYDARVDGDIAAQNALPPGECQGDACQAPPGVPPLESPASAGFNGPASPVAKKAKKHRAKKHRKKRHVKRSKARRANDNRRTGK